MDVGLLGTGGRGGWPQPGCRCASCAPGRGGRRPPRAHAGARGRAAAPRARPAAALRAGHRAAGLPGRPRLARAAGTSPARTAARLLAAGGPGAAPEPGRPGPTRGPTTWCCSTCWATRPSSARCGTAGLVRPRTVVAVLHADHRVTSERGAGPPVRLWGAVAPAGRRRAHRGRRARGPTRPASRPAPGQPRRVLVLGGARSGKSRRGRAAAGRASRRSPTWPPARTRTAPGPEADADWARAGGGAPRHDGRRWWQTVESADAAGALRHGTGAVLFDGIGTWLAAVMDEAGAWAAAGGRPAAAGPAWRGEGGRADRGLAADAGRGSSRSATRSARACVPPTQAGRLFRDQLGWLNQRLAAESEEVVLVVAGRVLTLPT